MPLDPQIRSLLAALKPLSFSAQISLQDLRKVADEQSKLVVSMAKEPVAEVRDLEVPVAQGRIRARVYIPRRGGDLPLVVYYHGGGFVFGNVETHDHICRRLARQADAVVVSVDYRLAPEHKFPTAVDDAYTALRWAADRAHEFGADPSKIAVAGDSAGGNLAAVVSILDRDSGQRLVRKQVLIYPVVNMTGIPTRSIAEYGVGEAAFLSIEAMSWFGKQYLGKPEDALDIRASPILADLKDLPPALIITVGSSGCFNQVEFFLNLSIASNMYFLASSTPR